MNRPRNPDVELKVEWSKREDDVMIHYPSSCDGHFMYGLIGSKQYSPRFTQFAKDSKDKIFCKQGNDNYHCIVEMPSFLDQLDKRGYDLKTLKLSIKKKQ